MLNIASKISKTVLIRAVGAQEPYKVVKRRLVVNEYHCQNCANCNKCDNYKELAATTDAIFATDTVCHYYKQKIDFLRKALPDEQDDYIFKMLRKEMQLTTYEAKYEYFRRICPTKPKFELEKMVQDALNSPCYSCQGANLEEYITYINEYNRYQIDANDRKLSKIELKALLYFHFLVDDFGFAQNISLVDVSKKLNCNIKSLKRAVEALQELNYIAYSYQRKNLQANHITIYIVDYTQCILPAQKGGRGYIVLSNDFFQQVACSSFNVNELRAAIRLLLKDDDNNFAKDNQLAKDLSNTDIKRSETTLTYKDSTRFFEPYLRYPKKVKELFTAAKDLFETTLEDVCVHFQIKERFNGKLVRSKKLHDCYNEVRIVNEVLHLATEEEDLWSLAQMWMQYGSDLLVEALFKVQRYLFKESKDVSAINNLAGYVRATIKNIIKARNFALN